MHENPRHPCACNRSEHITRAAPSDACEACRHVSTDCSIAHSKARGRIVVVCRSARSISMRQIERVQRSSGHGERTLRVVPLGRREISPPRVAARVSFRYDVTLQASCQPRARTPCRFCVSKIERGHCGEAVARLGDLRFPDTLHCIHELRASRASTATGKNELRRGLLVTDGSCSAALQISVRQIIATSAAAANSRDNPNNSTDVGQLRRPLTASSTLSLHGPDSHCCQRCLAATYISVDPKRHEASF